MERVLQRDLKTSIPICYLFSLYGRVSSVLHPMVCLTRWAQLERQSHRKYVVSELLFVMEGDPAPLCLIRDL